MHSPLGGSVASRFIKCPGSVNLVASLRTNDDPLLDEWREVGGAAHDLGAIALKEGLDAWELADRNFGWPLTPEDLNAVQEYLDYVRSRKHCRVQWVEEPVDGKFIHPDFYGTLDWGQYDQDTAILEIVDYKHGAGVVVDVKENSQLMYYAFGKLLECPGARLVSMTICQPRAAHGDGRIRTWVTEAERVLAWGYEILIPAMKKTADSDEFNPGSWCQFCPAKLSCWAAIEQFDKVACAPADPGILPNEQLSELFNSLQVAMFVKKAIEAEVLKRMLDGKTIVGAKLVKQKANRIFKEGADKVFKAKYGVEALTDPELKSAAQMEKLPGAKDLVKFWAYTPDTGLVAARADDKRHEVKPPSAADVFQHYTAKVQNDT